MAYVREEDCVSCGSCEAVCPTGAAVAADGPAFVNGKLCIDCGACIEVCPAGAIVEE